MKRNNYLKIMIISYQNKVFIFCMILRDHNIRRKGSTIRNRKQIWHSTVHICKVCIM